VRDLLREFHGPKTDQACLVQIYSFADLRYIYSNRAEEKLVECRKSVYFDLVVQK
jgi:hypothetical protein